MGIAFEIPSDYRKALCIQESLRSHIRIACRFPWKRLCTVAGADCSFEWRGKTGAAVFAVLSYPEMELVEWAASTGEASFPYIPGLLSFREIPLLLEAWERLRIKPDAIICDGQGIAHPRGMGLASHLGLVLDRPVVGAAKSRLIGEHVSPASERGSEAVLFHRGKRIGTVLRTQTNVKPLYVSPGHRIGFIDSCRLVLECTSRYRLPETTRVAHELVGQVRKNRFV